MRRKELWSRNPRIRMKGTIVKYRKKRKMGLPEWKVQWRLSN
jgi:hypothetical protein